MSANISVFAQIESFGWAKHLESDNYTSAYASQLDDQGNLIVAGVFRGTIDVDPGVGVDTLNNNWVNWINWSWYTIGNSDGIVAKYTPEGTLVWVKKFETFGSLIVNSIQFDEDQNIVLAGYYHGLIDFDPGPDTALFVGEQYYDPYAFVMKLDSVGNLIWVNEFHHSRINSMDIDENGNIYSTGVFNENVDFDPSDDEYYLYSGFMNTPETFVLKLNENGELVWVKQFPCYVQVNSAQNLVLDDDENMVISGKLSGPTDFDTDSTDQFILGEPSVHSIYFCKLDSSGAFIWAKSMKCSELATPSSAVVDSMNNSYTAINFIDSVNIDTGNAVLNIESQGGRNALILKLDSSGNYIWHEAYLSIYDIGIMDIEIDILGAVYTTGYFREEIDFDPSADSLFLSTDSLGAFIHKLDTEGSFQWAHKLTSENGYVWARSLCVDDSFEVYTSGVFTGYTDFGIGMVNQSIDGGEMPDIFMHKINQSISTVGVQENIHVNSINLSPNPAKSIVRIQSNFNTNAALYLVDLFGREIVQLDFKDGDEMSFDVSNYPSGIYFIQVLVDGELIQSEKLIVE